MKKITKGNLELPFFICQYICTAPVPVCTLYLNLYICLLSLYLTHTYTQRHRHRVVFSCSGLEVIKCEQGAGGRMASACCPHWPCPCDQLLKSAHFGEQTRREQEDHTDTISLPTNMDIALLKEQYNSIREKQKRETTVICFAKGKKKLVCVAFILDGN